MNSVNEDSNDPSTVDALINKYNEGSQDYTSQGATCIEVGGIGCQDVFTLSWDSFSVALIIKGYRNIIGSPSLRIIQDMMFR